MASWASGRGISIKSWPAETLPGYISRITRIFQLMDSPLLFDSVQLRFAYQLTDCLAVGAGQTRDRRGKLAHKRRRISQGRIIVLNNAEDIVKTGLVSLG